MLHSLPPKPPAIIVPVPASRAGAWIPAPRPWNPEEWRTRHDAFVARAKQGGIDVLFLGDSITDWFTTRGVGAWEHSIAALGTAVDFGISGDRTQWLLWRIDHGELDGCGAKVVVLMIGTNNLGATTPENVARGIASVLSAVRTRLPNAIIILNALLPRGLPDDPVRLKLAAVNGLIRPLADGKQVWWLDAGAGFLSRDGSIPLALMPDELHPSSKGYEVWASALRPVVDEALSQ
ncbi:MAG TPA: GDSL-type esterase/lipase family protein [Candidatus Acidoferrum sp.]|nr:GDSL-type esterase/lipase family protein [Candidatus Acidoferrum sp.]